MSVGSGGFIGCERGMMRWNGRGKMICTLLRSCGLAGWNLILRVRYPLLFNELHLTKVVTSLPFAILRQREPLILFVRPISILKSEKDDVCQFLLAQG